MDDDLWATAMHLFTPDAPVSMYGEMAEFAPGPEVLDYLERLPRLND